MTAARAGDSGVRTVFLGSGGFGRRSLFQLDQRDDVRLVGVVTAPSRPAGRDRRLRTSVIDDASRELGVKSILAPERLRAQESIAAVLALEPELLVLADYGQIVPAELLGLRYGALNLHPSLLPRHRGATPIPAAILAGDAETGVTLMKMDTGLDTGPIVGQEPVAIDDAATAPGLEEVLEIVADHLLDRNLGPWIRGELAPRPQSEAGATLTRPLRREDGRLDPAMPAVLLERWIRAYLPWPGTFIETDDGRFSVLGASLAEGEPRDVRGFIVQHGEGLALTTADGRLVLESVKPAGGRAMTGSAFLRGRPGLVGSVSINP